MRIVGLVLVGICLAGATLAQEIEPPLAFVPTFEAQPSAAELVRQYPPEALRQNISGIAVLCCTAQADRSAMCAISSEYPEGRGFGDASVRAARAYRLSEESYGDLVRRPGTQVRISMMWAGAVILPATVERLQTIDHETQEACLAPAVGGK